jgi:hypothetical protein
MCFPGISDICYKCFNYFGCMLQVFHLNIAKVDLCCTCCSETHLQQPHAATVGAVCMFVGMEGTLRCGRGTRSGAGHETHAGHGVGIGHGAAQPPR